MSTLTDMYGRTITSTYDSGADTTTAATTGISVVWPGTITDDDVTSWFDDHMPDDWTPPLAELQAQALATLQANKIVALASMPYAVGGTTYTVTLSTQDQLDCQVQIQMLTSAPAGTTIQWEIVDNVFLTWQLSDVQALEVAALTYIQTIYAQTAATVAAINAATDATSLAAVSLAY